MKSNGTVELLSWNVHYPFFAKDDAYALDLLQKNQDVDIICLQEYVEGASSKVRQWLEEQNYTISYLPFAHKGDLSQGVMTAVRKELSSKTVPIILRKDGPRRLRPFDNIRGLLATTIPTKYGDITIHNTHLTVPRPHLTELRKREFKVFQEYLQSLPADKKWILCGDFNFLPRDRRRAYLTESFAHFSGNLIRKTWRHHYAFTPIRGNLDYLFWSGFSPELPTKISSNRPTDTSPKISAQLLGFHHSDHRPIRARIY